METFLDCPGCSRKLRVRDDLQGRKIRCPGCGVTFPADAPATPNLALDAEPAPPPREPETVPLAPLPDEPASPQSRPGRARDLTPCPSCGELILRAARRCRYCDEDLDEEAESPRRRWRRRGRSRRDLTPHRGVLILVLGILSVVLFIPVGTILGMVTCLMGQADLRKMRDDEMDPDGQGMTRVGLLLGIISLVLCVSLVAIIVIAAEGGFK
jgi:predicted RNA-binding Zn-ribbon protein involved in translation (DUF1610 family)